MVEAADPTCLAFQHSVVLMVMLVGPIFLVLQALVGLKSNLLDRRSFRTLKPDLTHLSCFRLIWPGTAPRTLNGRIRISRTPPFPGRIRAASSWGHDIAGQSESDFSRGSSRSQACPADPQNPVQAPVSRLLASHGSRPSRSGAPSAVDPARLSR